MDNNYNSKVFETIDERTWKEKLQDKWNRFKIGVENFAAWAIQNPYLSVPLTIVAANIINRSIERVHENRLEQEKNRRLDEQLRYNREAMEYDRQKRAENKYRDIYR